MWYSHFWITPPVVVFLKCFRRFLFIFRKKFIVFACILFNGIDDFIFVFISDDILSLCVSKLNQCVIWQNSFLDFRIRHFFKSHFWDNVRFVTFRWFFFIYYRLRFKSRLCNDICTFYLSSYKPLKIPRRWIFLYFYWKESLTMKTYYIRENEHIFHLLHM